ncbi:helix-turn-helix transcriptional regulator [Clostridium sp.]|uniref:helix-turn-helix transcriptional regulator n=1 Tax=Clostridium sp. TaxID=1506 RepID=UPI003D6C91B7
MSYKLKAKRVEMGIKQGDLAKQLQITPQYLCKIEKGEISPRLDLMKKISEILETSVQELFF